MNVTKAAADPIADSPILIVGNQLADVDLVREQLQPMFRRLYTASSIQQGIRVLTDCAPRVVLLGFDPCTATESALAQMLSAVGSESASGRAPLFQTLVLCDRSEIRHAYGLALSGAVDDAVVHRPVHAPEQLQLRVWLALKRWETLARLEKLTALVSGVYDRVIGLDESWHATLAKSSAVGERTHEEQVRLAERIGSAVRELARPSERTDPGAPAAGTGSAEIDRALAAFGAHLGSALSEWRRDLEGSYRTLVAPLCESARAGERAATHIMIVDDDPLVLQTLAAMLEFDGYAVSTHSNATGVIEHALRTRPDMLLIDVNLDGADGLEVARRVKLHPQLSQVPVVMISGLGYGDVVRRSRAVGADDFIVKPLEVAAVRRKVADLLGAYRSRNGQRSPVASAA